MVLHLLQYSEPYRCSEKGCIHVRQSTNNNNKTVQKGNALWTCESFYALLHVPSVYLCLNRSAESTKINIEQVIAPIGLFQDEQFLTLRYFDMNVVHAGLQLVYCTLLKQYLLVAQATRLEQTKIFRSFFSFLYCWISRIVCTSFAMGFDECHAEIKFSFSKIIKKK